MELLFVNACPRGDESRTLRLAKAFLRELQNLDPTVTITEHNLPEMKLLPIDAQGLALREPLCDARDWAHPFLQPAVEFQRADAILIAAPYWDLAFPAMLKVWIENIYVRNLNFYYRDDQCIGLANARRAVYLTTAGSPIGQNDWGTQYVKAVLASLNVKEFESIRAEGIDLLGCDVEAVFLRAEKETCAAARRLIDLFQQ